MDQTWIDVLAGHDSNVFLSLAKLRGGMAGGFDPVKRGHDLHTPVTSSATERVDGFRGRRRYLSGVTAQSNVKQD